MERSCALVPHVSDEKCLRCRARRHHSDHHTQQGCQRNCVDENLERRNHYLDLAGIENYTSRFGTGESAGVSWGQGYDGERGGDEHREE